MDILGEQDGILDCEIPVFLALTLRGSDTSLTILVSKAAYLVSVFSFFGSSSFSVLFSIEVLLQHSSYVCNSFAMKVVKLRSKDLSLSGLTPAVSTSQASLS